MDKYLKFFAALLLIPLVYSFASEAALFVRSSVRFELIEWAVYGFVTYFLIHIFARQNLEFIRIFEHELGHLVAASLLFRSVDEFTVKPKEERKKGWVKFSGGISNFIISLAPYYLPIFTLPFLVLRFFVSSPIQNWVNFVIGFTLAFHYAFLLEEFRRDQSDIADTGFLFSFCVTSIMNIIFLVLTLSAVLGSFSILPSFFERAFQGAIEFGQRVLQAWEAARSS